MQKIVLFLMFLSITSCVDSNADWCAVGGYVHPEGPTIGRWAHNERIEDADLEDLYKKNCGR